MLREGLLAFLDAGYIETDVIAPRSRFEHACIERLVDMPISSWLAQREYSEIDDWVAVHLAYAHQRGYVHRDIKSHNLHVNNDSNVVLADFGLAKCLIKANIWGPNGFYKRKIIGTPAFMAREQVDHTREVRPWTDVWAVAAVFYWLLCGRIPRDVSGGRRDAFFEVQRNPIVSIRRRLPGLPEALSTLLDNALSDDPEQRPENAEAIREKLEQAMILIAGTAK